MSCLALPRMGMRKELCTLSDRQGTSSMNLFDDFWPMTVLLFSTAADRSWKGKTDLRATLRYPKTVPSLRSSCHRLSEIC